MQKVSIISDCIRDAGCDLQSEMFFFLFCLVKFLLEVQMISYVHYLVLKKRLGIILKA